PASLQLVAVERELEVAGVVALVRVFLRLPRPAVPQEHRAPAVLALGDDALELAVLDGMVLDVHRQAPLERVEARPLRHRPALERAFELEAEVVVQPRRRMLLDDEGAVAARAAGRPARG